MSNIVVQLEDAPKIEVDIIDSDEILVNIETPEIIEVEVVNGLKGDKGDGVAVGGDTGQFLRKKSGIDFDTEWSSGLTAVIWGDIIGDIEDQIDLQGALDNKVDKIFGKGLSTNDLTDTLKQHYDEAYSKEHDHTNKSTLDLVSGTNTGDQIIPDQLSDLSDDSTHRLVTDTEKSAWNGKQDALGFTPENSSNKKISFQLTPDDTHYPSEKLVKDSLDGKSDTSHNHALNNLSEKSYNSLTDKPVTRATPVSLTPANPTAITSSDPTFKMFGLGSTFTMTPLSTGCILVVMNFYPFGVGVNGKNKFKLVYGTGVAPINGASATGTQIGITKSGGASSGISTTDAPIIWVVSVSGLSVGVQYWFDVQGAKYSSNTNVQMQNIEESLIEI